MNISNFKLPPLAGLSTHNTNNIRFGSMQSIGNCPISVVSGDITQLQMDGYVVPQFLGEASYGGVGGAVARGGGASWNACL
jgi:hypothetical protein